MSTTNYSPYDTGECTVLCYDEAARLIRKFRKAHLYIRNYDGNFVGCVTVSVKEALDLLEGGDAARLLPRADKDGIWLNPIDEAPEWLGWKRRRLTKGRLLTRSEAMRRDEWVTKTIAELRAEIAILDANLARHRNHPAAA